MNCEFKKQMAVISYELQGSIALISINNPPVNALSWQLRHDLNRAIDRAQSDSSQVVLIVCEGRTFIAGADITEFGQPPKQPLLSELLAAIESSTKPVVAAIHGTALGGGFELALACHYRCATKGARVGLPEVKLGLLPGAGGTQRVPRLAGIEAALNLITSGAPLAADEAESHGLIDRVIEGELLGGALAYAEELAAQRAPLRRASDLAVNVNEKEMALFDGYRTRIKRRFPGQLAPQLIIDCVEAAASRPFDEGLRFEHSMFSQCLKSPQSAAMRHLFFAERQAAKVDGLDPHTTTRKISQVGIIGAGTMGGGIAMSFANAGIPVLLLECNQHALQQGMQTIRNNYQISVKRGRLSEAALAERLTLISGSTSFDDLKSADLVIEAVFEELETKTVVFSQLEQVCKPSAILATNTSFLDVNLIAAATTRPEQVIGLHFFSPANVMRLLEVIRGAESADETVATAMRLARVLGKVPVLAGVCHGFIGNRMFSQYLRESQMLLLEGATPTQVDSAICDWGMAMGPLAVSDLAGLDIGYKARQANTNLPDDPRYFRIGNRLVEMGRLGQKSGAGFYRYESGTRECFPDPLVDDAIRREARQLGVEQRAITDEEIVERLIYSLINQGAYILEEKIAQRPGDIDIVFTTGYGFPVHRGGPMFYADQVGLDEVYASICKYRERTDNEYNALYWKPAPLLERLARTAQGF